MASLDDIRHRARRPRRARDLQGPAAAAAGAVQGAQQANRQAQQAPASPGGTDAALASLRRGGRFSTTPAQGETPQQHLMRVEAIRRAGMRPELRQQLQPIEQRARQQETTEQRRSFLSRQADLDRSLQRDLAQSEFATPALANLRQEQIRARGDLQQEMIRTQGGIEEARIGAQADRFVNTEIPGMMLDTQTQKFVSAEDLPALLQILNPSPTGSFSFHESDQGPPLILNESTGETAPVPIGRLSRMRAMGVQPNQQGGQQQQTPQADVAADLTPENFAAAIQETGVSEDQAIRNIAQALKMTEAEVRRRVIADER